MANRLIHETSPYLLQHAHNPVDWYPWGEEALEKAKEEDKPILLSIGYSACHWCHVMERESFENVDIAKTMNESFVSIKVDREERPDLDSIYMQAVQALTGQGGWPMTVFLTPQGEPFYGGTYFPPEDRGGMPGFHGVLKAMDEAYRTRRGDVGKATSELVNRLQQTSRIKSNTDLLTRDVLDEAFLHLAAGFDEQNGGFGDAPKFPQPMIYDFLLRYHHSTNNEKALQILNLSLEKMALGGMYDQLGGGFHRYSTDSYWLVPHFEKMLYDNALLSRLYLHAFQATGHDLYLRIVQETLNYVLREMTDEEGGFYSSQDADSEGEEGKFFVWTPKEVEEALGEEDAHIFNAYYDVTSVGNFEGNNILNVPRDAETVTDELDVTPERLEEVLQRGKKALLEVRERRVPPARDDKILTAWNGLMLRSFAEAAAVLQREDYRNAAIANATFITRDLQKEGRLLRTYRDGQAKLKGYLEDYSFLADGLMAVYELTFDQRWLDEARRLVDDMVDLFWEEDEGVFYDTGKDHETLLVRPRELFDNAI
ncbi:MAG: thioredoxin domain-containing protein, partial [Dehalococcoidia bacterium]